ncbi:MAG TPA: C40 family peptidase [Mycobacteriales bacterium]|nr:C40 family peptidase [Mycobacteriales bacterium]
MPRHPQPDGRRPLVRPTAVLVAVIATLALLPAADVRAEPTTSINDARRELNALNVEVDDAVEDYATTQISLTAARRRAAAAAAKVTREEVRLRELRADLSEMVGAIYMSGGGDQIISLVTTSSPTDFLDRAATLDSMARTRESQLRAAATIRRRLTAEQARAAAAHQAAEAVARTADRTRATIEAKVARQERLLNRLETAQARRERLDRLAREARAARAARAARLARASRDRTQPTYTGSAEGRAAIAVQAAHAQLGKPYRWGAEGPDSFDCSGLTMFVWAKAGVSLPHSSRAQRGMGRSISRSELRPGDLIFRGSPTIHHVGIYIGNGTMIAAPQTGDVVKFQPAFAGEYAGAVRL